MKKLQALALAFIAFAVFAASGFAQQKDEQPTRLETRQPTTGEMMKLATNQTGYGVSINNRPNERTVSVASTTVAEPQAKCQSGFIYIQFQGEEGWVQTMKKCDMRATPPKLDTTKVGRRLTQAQLDSLLKSYLSGQPLHHDVYVCCCQPGWTVYDSAEFKCMSTGGLNPR